MEDNKELLARYSKLSITLKSYLKGRNYHKALEAFEFAKNYHTGVRKDKTTPEFQHQIEICLFITTLKELEDEETTIIATLLHDVREDYGVEHEVIEKKFGKKTADVVEKLTKEFKGIKKNIEVYFREIANDPIASIVKGVDRIHNYSSMVGVFTIPAQEKYVDEVKNWFMPMLKIARNKFPHQLMSYYSITTFLNTMTKTIEAVLKAEKQLIELKGEQTKEKPAQSISVGKSSLQI